MGLFDWLRGIGGAGASASVEAEPLDADADAVEGPVAEVVGGTPADFRAEAEDLVTYWNTYDLDYRPESLAALDTLAVRQRERSGYVSTETDAGDSVTFLPAAAGSGCYFGEVLVRAHGGTWTEDDGGWVVTVEGPEGRTAVDVFAVAHDCLDDDASFVDVADAALRSVGRRD